MPSFSLFEEEIDRFIDNIQPNQQSNEIRKRIFLFFKTIIERKIDNALLVGSGSTYSRTYLPDGDLDLVLLSRISSSSEGKSDEVAHLNRIFEILCEEIAMKEQGKSNYPHFSIRNVEFINARTKLLHCTVNNLGVDITFQQIGAVHALQLMDQVDRMIGNHHLFKRSVLLIKVSTFQAC